jgi:hypothetical protein
MKVKILKCSFKQSWYQYKIGEILDVVNSVYDSKKYYQLKGHKVGYLILKSDTEKIKKQKQNEN